MDPRNTSLDDIIKAKRDVLRISRGMENVSLEDNPLGAAALPQSSSSEWENKSLAEIINERGIGGPRKRSAPNDWEDPQSQSRASPMSPSPSPEYPPSVGEGQSPMDVAGDQFLSTPHLPLDQKEKTPVIRGEQPAQPSAMLCDGHPSSSEPRARPPQIVWREPSTSSQRRLDEERSPSSGIPPNPISSSLESIIAAKKKASSSQDGPSKPKFRKKQEDTETDQWVRPAPTAFRSVGVLSKSGIVIEMKIGKLKNANGNRSHLWRCQMKSDGIEVVADCQRKVVAREMAAVEFLKKFLDAQPTFKVPKYQVFDELFIDPKIYTELEKLAKAQGIQVTYDVGTRKSTPAEVMHYDRAHIYWSTYHVGPNNFCGASSILEFAKLQAASKALLDLYKRPSNPTVYFVGGDCTPPEEDYAFMEEETFQHLSHKNDMIEDAEEND